MRLLSEAEMRSRGGHRDAGRHGRRIPPGRSAPGGTFAGARLAGARVRRSAAVGACVRRCAAAGAGSPGQGERLQHRR